MAPKSKFDYTVLTLRVSLGVWFAFLGGLKLFQVGPQAFARQAAEFEILQDPYNLGVAYAVAWLEVLCGLGLMTGFMIRGAVRWAVGLTLLFLFVNAQAMVRGLDPDCGCFGKAFTLGMGPKIVLLCLQLAVLVFLIVSEHLGRRRVFGGSRMQLPS
ncbi:putative membrane protein YphA (DoxX/SURF4 family) [Haloferula luteola]|uniref:Putative membrane protein YphA (DoxX/SURF4 family) n=1 Tax=Haloferula luteola TaxID=595692 RepID=A0A840VE62_9BACT|nr:MauE/DoxX family redox-associated membrane protein [Haloferula luteola]MBB5353794.1 putative membrane protein YphA (DoxX/SURF4 family) [Haloferula luteola]